MSSYDGSRSARQSKRYSMSALYMSMSANDSDLVIEDELAKGRSDAGHSSGLSILTWM
jgi:Ras GTPase-activating-like protein IQGAP2/3